MPPKSSKKADPTMTSTGKKSIDAEPDDQEFDEPAVEMIGPLDDGNANGLTDAEKSNVALADMIKALLKASLDPITQRLNDLEGQQELIQEQELLQEQELPQEQELLQEREPIQEPEPLQELLQERELEGMLRESLRTTPMKPTKQATSESLTSTGDVAAATAAADEAAETKAKAMAAAEDLVEVEAQAELMREGKMATCVAALHERLRKIKPVPATFGESAQQALDATRVWATASNAEDLLWKDPKGDYMKIIATKLNSDVTGLSAAAALSFGRRSKDGTVSKGEECTPASRAIDLVIGERTDTFMATLKTTVNSDSGAGAGTMLKVLGDLHREKKAGVKHFEPNEVLRRVARLCRDRGEDLGMILRTEASKFLLDTSPFETGELANGIDSWSSECATLRSQALSLSADNSILGDAPLETFFSKLTGKFELMVQAGETAYWTLNERVEPPYDRIERYEHFTVMIEDTLARATTIAVKMDAKHVADESRRRGGAAATAAAQHKAATDKAAKDKATKESNEKAAKDKASKDAAAKLRANAAMTRGPFCYDCGKCHHASDTCIHAGKGKVCWNCGDSDHQKPACPKPVAGNGSAQTW